MNMKKDDEKEHAGQRAMEEIQRVRNPRTRERKTRLDYLIEKVGKDISLLSQEVSKTIALEHDNEETDRSIGEEELER
jgi:hypothetical protein